MNTVLDEFDPIEKDVHCIMVFSMETVSDEFDGYLAGIDRNCYLHSQDLIQGYSKLYISKFFSPARIGTFNQFSLGGRGQL
jgi:hypothetical protein